MAELALLPMPAEDPRECQMRAFDVLKNAIPPEVLATVLENIDAQRTATAIRVVYLRDFPERYDAQQNRPLKWQEVGEIMGGPIGRFFGPDFMKEKRGIDMLAEHIPDIKITEAQALEAKKHGDIVSIHTDVLGNGKPSNIQELDQDGVHRRGWRAVRKQQRDRWIDRPFSKIADKREWRQTSTRYPRYASGNNYFNQLVAIGEYIEIEGLRGLSVTPEEQRALVQLAQFKPGIEFIFSNLDQGSARNRSDNGMTSEVRHFVTNMLANLEMTNLARQTAVGYLHDVTNMAITGDTQCLFDFVTTSTHDDGKFIGIGRFGDHLNDGPAITSFDPYFDLHRIVPTQPLISRSRS